MILTLIRGVPGSGKSTLARQQAALHFEADMFFIKNGVYCYEEKLLKQAHAWCQQQTALALQQGHSVVVSNTFIYWWQIKPYIYLAKQYNAAVNIIEATGNYQNIHAVPDAVIAQMKAAYENQEEIVKKITRLLPSFANTIPTGLNPPT